MAIESRSEIKGSWIAGQRLLSESHWSDFLQNGPLDKHPESDDGFFFARLSPQQMAKLLEVLDASPMYIRESMTGWLRHRVGRADEELCS